MPNLMQKLTILTVTAVACVGMRLGHARADLGACGKIDVQVNAQCEVVPPGATCEAMCTPISLQVMCAVQLAADCQPKCTKLPSIDCQASCSASCEADCSKLSAGKFDCQGACSANCSGRCSGECKSKSDSASCEASCRGSCSASCNVHCAAEPPMADCKAQCRASCQGSCEVDPNLECQLNCQAQARAACEANLEGGCKVKCKSQEGAIFCAGQYIDYGDNLQQCIDALKAKYNIRVSGEAQGTSSCDSGLCTAQGSARGKINSNCSVANPGRHTSTWLSLYAIGLAFSCFGLRRRR